VYNVEDARSDAGPQDARAPQDAHTDAQTTVEDAGRRYDVAPNALALSYLGTNANDPA
jgi:hypothetical protein